MLMCIVVGVKCKVNCNVNCKKCKVCNVVSWRARCKASDVGVVAPRRLLHCTQSESCTIYTLCKNWLLHLTFPFAIISVYILFHFCSTPNVMQCNACNPRAAQFIQHNLQKLAPSYISVCNIYLHVHYILLLFFAVQTPRLLLR